MEICSSDLVLRCVGGTQDGRRIPIKTKKCLLGHGFDLESQQKSTAKVAIFRGPTGTAVRTYSPDAKVNGKNTTVIWLQKGDQIQLPNLTIEVEQLGQWPNENPSQETESPQPHSENVESDLDTTMNQEQTDKVDLELEAKLDAMRQKMSQIQNEFEAMDQEDSGSASDYAESESTESSATSLIEETLAKIQASNDEEQLATEVAKPAEPQNESVAEVLARMQAAGQITNVDPELISEEQTAQPVESAVQDLEPKIEQPAQPSPEPVEAPSSDEPSDDMEYYMNQLFQRLRGPAAGATAAAATTSSKPKNSSATDSTQTQKQDVQKTVSSVHQPINLLSADEFKPKKVAPERESNIDAMRELANQNSRSAVELSRAKRHQATRMAQLVITAGGAIASCVLFFMSSALGDAFFYGGVGAALASLIAGGRYFATNIMKKKTTDE